MSLAYPVEIRGQKDYEQELNDTLGTSVGPDEVYQIGCGQKMTVDEFKDQIDL